MRAKIFSCSPTRLAFAALSWLASDASRSLLLLLAFTRAL